MSKAILVIDMPSCCEKCRLINSHYDNDYGWQTYCGADYHRIREKNKKYFCPLKEMPQKKIKLKGRGKDHCEYSLLEQLEYKKGWNDCLDTLLGEEE